MTDDTRLTTEDLARGGEAVRGRRTEEIAGRADAELAERPDSAEVAAVRRASAEAAETGRSAEMAEARTKASVREPRDVGPSMSSEPSAPLFTGDEAERFRQRWNGIQTGFVDEPRRAVQDADALVAEIMQRLAEVFATERTTLEQQWDRGDNVTTEDLRISLTRYRSFFGRLLSV